MRIYLLKTLRKNSLVTGSAVYLVSNVLNALIPFTLLPILTRYLSPEEYGEVAMFQTLLGSLAAFVGLSMQGAAGRKFYDGNLGDEELKDFIGSCMQILLVTSLVTFVLLFGFSGQLSEWMGLERQWILLAVAVTASSVIVQIRLGQWQVRKQAKQYGLMQVSEGLLNFVLSLALVVIFAQGAGGHISAQIIAAITFAALALWLLKRDGLLKLMLWNPGHVREALQFGVPLIPHVGGMFLLSAVDRFVINSELGLAQVGVYMVAVQCATALSLVFDAVNKAYVPWLFERLKRDDYQEKRMIVRFTYAWYVMILCVAGLAFLIGPWVVSLIAGEGYARSGEVFAWLVLGRVFGGMYLMVTNYIFFSKRTGLLSLITVSSGLINILLLLVLINHFGLEGAAYSFCIAMCTRFLLTWWLAQKRHPMPWFALIATPRSA
jgi:O-antigen/teichoic acid export membrane protein